MMVMSVPDATGQTVWQDVQRTLKQHMTAPSYETWISPLTLDRLKNEHVVLQTDSAFKRDWVLKHYRHELEKAFQQVCGLEVCEVTIQIGQPTPLAFEKQSLAPSTDFGDNFLFKPPSSPKSNPQEGQQTSMTAGPAGEFRAWTPRTTVANLNPHYTFDTLVRGHHNQFCYAAALAVAESPAQSYNPFFVHGGVGLGKTHLIQAIGHFVLQHYPDQKVKYVTAEHFTNELISAIAKKQWNRFRDCYRQIDLLIIDDVQFLSGKERTQQELFHTFNVLQESGKQIILSSDRPPNQLLDLEDRLRSRFEWGLIVDIKPPDAETRLAILQSKAERNHLSVPEDVLRYLSENGGQSVRALEGALNKVSAYGMLTKTPLTVAVAQQMLGLELDAACLSQHRILEVVARYYHLEASDLQSPSRLKDIVFARQVAVYMIRKLTQASFPKIGKLLGGRQHGTIVHGYEKISKELTTRPVLVQQIHELTTRIQASGRS